MRLPKIDIHIHLENKADAVEHMLQTCDVYDIGTCVIQTLTPSQGVAQSFADNDAAETICQLYPDRFKWFCNAEPSTDEALYDRLEGCKTRGAVGFGELTGNYEVDDVRIQHLFACCEALELPILFHMSSEIGKYYGIVDSPKLPKLEKALQQYPRLKLIGHSQPFWNEISLCEDTSPAFRYSYPSGKITEGRLQCLLEDYPNLYADLSANSGGNALLRDPDHAMLFLERFQNKLLFGTDHFSPDYIYPLGPWLDQMAALQKLDKKVYEKVVRSNAIKLFAKS